MLKQGTSVRRIGRSHSVSQPNIAHAFSERGIVRVATVPSISAASDGQESTVRIGKGVPGLLPRRVYLFHNRSVHCSAGPE